MDVLVFCLGSKEQFGINVLSVKEIMPIGTLTQVPGAAREIAGCMNERGKSVPVIKLAEAIFRDRVSSTDGLGIILDRDEPYALAVSSVERIIKITKEQEDQVQRKKPNALVSGVYQDTDAMIQILNTEYVIKKILA